MNKRIWSLLLCLAIVLSMAMPVYADQMEEEEIVRTPDMVISDVKDFLAFAEDCRLDSFSRDLYVVLDADIDLSGKNFAGVPTFSGTFDGTGHKISGLELTGNGSNRGLFRYLTDTALVQDLHVEGAIQPGGSRSCVGGIAGQNAGSIIGCSFSGTVSGTDGIGGIAGTNMVTGIIENCQVSGEIHGDHFVGGIAGENLGVIRVCENRAQINITAQQNSVDFADITLDTLTNSEAVNTVTDIGGIAGISTGVIRSCVNYAGVGYKHMGYNVGGIAGTQSGYITDCENYGLVQGRKEVGGLVGQMEPAAVVEYSEDTLQILQGQLNTMGDLVNRASGNAQGNAAGIANRLGALQDQAANAKAAVDSLIPDLNDPSLPDWDTLVAAENTLTGSITGMTGNVRGLVSATEGMVNGLTRDLQAVSNQIGVMSNTINHAGDNLGINFVDVSDSDTMEAFTGKVENCVNYADVLGEVNVGGIAGAMAMENDLDIQEDWDQSGEASLNFSGEIRAVALNCENRGVVTGKKQNVGGIVGWQSVGLVKKGTNTGKIDGANADYVGGISGMSTGFIRACGVKSQIFGNARVGGIAGTATVVSDSLSMVEMIGVREQVGAVLGQLEKGFAEIEAPIARNFYLCVGEEFGAIDGISYEGMAEDLSQGEFLVLENLANIFKSVTIRFVFEDGTVETVQLAPGGRLREAQIPEVPEKSGYSGVWAGLAEAELTNILFDMQFETQYTAYRTTIASSDVNENGKPLALVEGSFTDRAQVSIVSAQAMPALAEKEVLLEAWQLQISESAHTVHLWYGGDAEQVKVLVDGVKTDYYVNGSYLVLDVQTQDPQICLVQVAPGLAWWILAAAGGAALLVLIVVIASVKNRKKKASAIPVE